MIRAIVSLAVLLPISAVFSLAEESEPGNDGADQPVYFPADKSPADYVISEDEFNTFKWTWRLNQDWPDSGTKISIDEASLSGTIYFGHEGAYHVQYDTEGNPFFVPGAPPDGHGDDGNFNDVTLTPIGFVPATIYIEVNPPVESVAYCVEELVPEGWNYRGGGGTYSESDNTVRWGPAPAGHDSLEYEVFSTLGGRLPGAFSGIISFDGKSQTLDTHYAEPLYGESFGSHFWDNEETTIDPGKLWAFALLGDPEAEYAFAYPKFAMEQVNGRNCFKTKLYRYKWADDVVFEFQYSTNLKDWYPVENTEFRQRADHNADVMTFDVTIPCEVADDQAKFYRLKVKHDPI